VHKIYLPLAICSKTGFRFDETFWGRLGAIRARLIAELGGRQA
jgi:hypothetical protein